MFIYRISKNLKNQKNEEHRLRICTHIHRYFTYQTVSNLYLKMEIRVVYLLKSKYFCNYKLHHNRFAKQHRDSIVEIILAEIKSDSDIELLRIQKVQITSNIHYQCPSF